MNLPKINIRPSVNTVFVEVIVATHSLSIMGLRHFDRYSKVSQAAVEVRRIVTFKGGWQALVERDIEEILVCERDPEVIHAMREILRIVASPAHRFSVRYNEIHYRLFHRLPWETIYGPEKCPVCGCEINDLGYCCCSGAAD